MIGLDSSLIAGGRRIGAVVTGNGVTIGRCVPGGISVARSIWSSLFLFSLVGHGSGCPQAPVLVETTGRPSCPRGIGMWRCSGLLLLRLPGHRRAFDGLLLGALG